MHTLKLALAALLFTAGLTVCQANLGDTEAQCIARYGPESGVQANLGFDVVGDKAAFFNLKTSQGSVLMNVIFYNGIAGLEKMTNAESSHDIPEEQKQAILDSERAGFRWEEQATTYRTDRANITSGKQSWLRSDGATAICWMSGKLTTHHGWGEIDLSTKQYASAQRTLDQQD